MIKINEVIVVEGEYDRKTLENIVDATIITTDGFRIFKDAALMKMLADLAKKRGLLILTDSDRAGFAIRNRIISCVEPKYIKNAYIPDIKGKEKRKAQPSKEGFLGVEGMSVDVLTDVLQRAGVIDVGNVETPIRRITKTDLYEDGLFGRDESYGLRLRLIDKLGLPRRLSSNKLLEVLNIMLDYDEYKGVVNSLE